MHIPACGRWGPRVGGAVAGVCVVLLVWASLPPPSRPTLSSQDGSTENPYSPGVSTNMESFSPDGVPLTPLDLFRDVTVVTRGHPFHSISSNNAEASSRLNTMRTRLKNKNAAKPKGNIKYSLNDTASELLPLVRALPNNRPVVCDSKRYDTKSMPSVSVVIPFHKETWSVLLRTVHSVIARTPAPLLREIILVDDHNEDLDDVLVEYMRALKIVKLLRTKQRQGLVRARMLGSLAAQGEVLVFLDAHVEVNVEWLEPLLEQIVDNRMTLAVPAVDAIAADDLSYADWDAHSVGTFDWELQYVWRQVQGDELRQWTSGRAIPSSTVSGCAMAVHRQTFMDLGGLDDGLVIWGGENLELSFRFWSCGGAVVVVPCSRVGHVFRKFLPYVIGTRPFNVIQKNLQRVAEVWMDEYKSLFYHATNKVVPFSKYEYKSLEARKNMRVKMKCKPFKWILDKFKWPVAPPSEYVLSGQIKLVYGRVCLTFDPKVDKDHQTLTVAACNRPEQQTFHHTTSGKLIYGATGECVTLGADLRMFRVGLQPCWGKSGRNYSKADTPTVVDKNGHAQLEEYDHQKWTFSPVFPDSVERKLAAGDLKRPVGQLRMGAHNFRFCLTVARHLVNQTEHLITSLWECKFEEDNQFWVFTHRWHWGQIT